MRPTPILYIDDDPGIGRLVQRHLERAGFAVRLARSGAEGLALLAAERFDAVGLDHYMPEQDGLEVLRRIRAMPAPPPVVFVTAAEEPRIAVTALKEGAADYVVKDVHGAFLELLGTSMRQALDEVRLRQERDAAEQELRESRDRLARLTEQQAILLREVNHRVANSLQLIGSLLELQGRRLGDKEGRDALRAAAERVEAVALVHRRLYGEGDVQSVEMDQYLGGLVEELRRVTEDDAGNRIVLRAEAGRVATDKAVGVGLIVNELVTNAVKYAYPAGQGEIRVDFGRDGEGWRLVVEDDGIGYPQGDAGPRGSGLGGLIVGAMAQSVNGRVSLDPAHKGTRFVLEFAQ